MPIYCSVCSWILALCRREREEELCSLLNSEQGNILYDAVGLLSGTCGTGYKPHLHTKNDVYKYNV